MGTCAELSAPPLGLYVHLPWCVRKCPYCDFNSHALRGDLPAADYIDALIRDLDEDVALAGGRTVSSVYFGGGTPSLFDATHMATLLAEIRARLPLAGDAEVTLEANPGTVERDRFSGYREAGVTRVSLGVQSFDDALLGAIGRIHGRAEVEAALADLQTSGIANFNIDLMYALPGQTVAQAVADLELALTSGAEHISHYQLTLEPNTEFAVRPPPLPDEEAAWAMQEAAESLLAAGGFEQYEISAWARPGKECRHNLLYWEFGDYLGIGAGAHAKLTDAPAGRILRFVKQRHPRRYMAGQRLAETRELSEPDRVFEFFLNGLRLRRGITRNCFSARTGLDWERASGRVGQALQRGLLEAVPGGFRPSPTGWRFVNDLQALFLP